MEARRAHNPEVVGSSPASATIKNTGFQKKSGVFLTFWDKMRFSKTRMELVLELAPKMAKSENGENRTFLQYFSGLLFITDRYFCIIENR